MDALIAPEGGFPTGRKASCCDRKVRPGESVLTVEIRVGGSLKGHNVLHKRCVEDYCAGLPDDAGATQKRFNALRERIRTTGDPFPDRPKRPKRGERVVIDLASRRKAG